MNNNHEDGSDDGHDEHYNETDGGDVGVTDDEADGR